MNLLDIIEMSFKNLWRRKTRTFLTVLGVIIGTASIVVMMSIGIGMDESFKREMENMGSLNIIEVNTYGGMDEGQMMDPSKKPVLDDKALAAFSNISGVEAVTPLMYTSLKFVSGKYVAYGRVVGMDVKAMEAFDFKVSEGRLITKADTNAVVFGSYITQEFYNPKLNYYGGGDNSKPPVDVLRDRMSMTFDMEYGERRQPGAGGEPNKKPPKLYKVKCIGVLEQSNDEKDYSAYMDIEQLKKLIQADSRNQRGQQNGGNRGGGGFSDIQQGYEMAKVKVKNINDVDNVQKQIKEMGFGTYSLADIRESMQKTSQTVQMVLGAIGAVSLLVASLGITNTMVMSIYERTREIGVMKVLGCELSNIRSIFLLEAGAIGFLGGVAGMGLSYGASGILNYFASRSENMGMFMPIGDGMRISVIPPWLALSSIVFAMVIGLVSGLYPARRAMKLSALEAIKTE